MRRTWMMFALSATLCSCIFATILPSTAFANSFYVVSCSAPENHDAADLCEQRRMSEAAETAAWWSKAQTIVGAAGFIGVLISLFFSGASTRSASQQVRLSRHALISTDRAFVYSDGTLWVANVNAKTNIVERWLVSVKWKNFGATPTRDLRIRIFKELRDTPLPDDFAFTGMEVEEFPAVLAPGAEIESNQLVLSLEEMDSLHSGAFLYIWGWAEYDDVFEGTKRHRTEFCHQWWAGGNPRKPDVHSTRYSLYARHNGADEECEMPLVTRSLKNA